MKTLFPSRVWQPTGNGWVSREPTAEDYARRKEYREKLRTLQNPVNKLRAYKFRFYPTATQAKQLEVEFGNSRFAWNHALDMRSKAYKRRKESMNYVSLGKHFTKLKKTTRYAWLADSTAATITQKLIDLDTAFTNFFKHGAKYPRFKKKSHGQSVRYQFDQRQIANNYRPGELLKLPKLGAIELKWSLHPAGIPKMATVSKTSTGKYFVSFACEVDIQPWPSTGKQIGADVGIKDVIVTSDGYFSGAPKFTYQHQKQLRSAQRNLSRKTKGSGRWHKQRIVVARIHEKIANSRKDFLHKLSTKLVRENDLICLEDLSVSGMMKNRCLSKAVADVGIFELNRQIKYKAEWYGKTVSVISRWEPTTKTCSGCGQVHEMKLSDRVMSCDCGLVMNRDLNAAINILTAGKVVRGGASSDVEKVAA